MRPRSLVLVLSWAMGCGSGGGASGAPSGPDGATAGDGSTIDSALPGDGGAETTSDVRPGDASDGAVPSDDLPFAEKRKSCAFKAGALPSETFGPSIVATKIPIDVLVIVIHENRSFDHYLSRLPAYGQPDVDVAKPDATIPDPTGKPVARFHQADYCFEDPGHGWNTMHKDWNDGKNDGFAQQNATTADPTGSHVLGWFDQTDIPFYYALASTYGTADRYFCPTLTQTGPNRFYAYGATSWGSVSNADGPPAGAKTIFTAMLAAKIPWKVYTTASTGYSFEHSIFPSLPDANFGPMTDYEADAAAGKLPNVVFLYAGSDEHPPSDMQKGEVDVQKAFTTLTSSPQWPRSAFVLTYDENGGLYDHAPPPPACIPDDIAPKLASGDVPGKFDRYGFRVPFILASPWSKPHFVSHVENSHTSILRFIELRFGLPALTARDANASALMEFFDFGAPSFAKPATMPKATVDAARSTASGCK